MLYIKDGKIKDGSRIIVISNGFQTINPTEEMILADGWKKYVPESTTPTTPVETIDDQIKDLIIEQYNEKVDINDAEALKRPLLVLAWSSYIGKSLKAGQIVSYNDKLYRIRQDIEIVSVGQEPSSETTAFYEVIEVQSETE